MASRVAGQAAVRRWCAEVCAARRTGARRDVRVRREVPSLAVPNQSSGSRRLEDRSHRPTATTDAALHEAEALRAPLQCRQGGSQGTTEAVGDEDGSSALAERTLGLCRHLGELRRDVVTELRVRRPHVPQQTVHLCLHSSVPGTPLS